MGIWVPVLYSFCKFVPSVEKARAVLFFTANKCSSFKSLDCDYLRIYCLGYHQANPFLGVFVGDGTGSVGVGFGAGGIATTNHHANYFFDHIPGRANGAYINVDF